MIFPDVGRRVRIKKHENVSMLLWGKFGTIMAMSESTFGGHWVVLTDNGDKVKLWSDQLEQDVLGELAAL